MTNTKTMVYVGASTSLKGRLALVKRESLNSTQVEAQFGFPEGTQLDIKGVPMGSLDPIASSSSRDIVPSFADEHPECFGWATYPASDFNEV